MILINLISDIIKYIKLIIKKAKYYYCILISSGHKLIILDKMPCIFKVKCKYCENVFAFYNNLLDIHDGTMLIWDDNLEDVLIRYKKTL